MVPSFTHKVISSYHHFRQEWEEGGRVLFLIYSSQLFVELLVTCFYHSLVPMQVTHIFKEYVYFIIQILCHAGNLLLSFLRVFQKGNPFLFCFHFVSLVLKNDFQSHNKYSFPPLLGFKSAKFPNR